MTGPSVSGFSDINKLPKAVLAGSTKKREINGKVFLDLLLKNSSDKISFFTQARLMDKEGSVLPSTFYSDNFFSLLPGEVRSITIEASKGTWSNAKRLAVVALNTDELNLKF